MYTIGLNIIVGGGESFELERCLKSAVDKDFFDQIVITVTTADPEVKKVAEKYTKDVHYFEWIEDFGAARAFCASKTDTDYIMWLDADDVIPENTKKGYSQIKEIMKEDQFDLLLIPYDLDFSTNGVHLQTMLRDRIFNRHTMKWKYRVHEQLVHVIKDTIPKSATVKGIAVQHYPSKSPESGLRRNIKIATEEYAVNPKNFHYAFYLARDLALIKDYGKSIEIFDYIIINRIGNPENLYTAAYNIALYYIYDEKNNIKPDTIEKGENYARVAQSFAPNFAEPYVLLGDIYYFRGLIGDAVRLFKTAMQQGIDGRGVKLLPYYEGIPSERLAKIYFDSNKKEDEHLEQALYYNKIALRHFPDEEELINRHNKIIDKICEGRPEMKGGIR